LSNIFNILSTSSICSEYEDAALKTQSSLAYLDFGQNVILSSALSAAMVLSSYGVMSGALTVGDLVILYVNHLCFVSSTITFLSVILLKGVSELKKNHCLFSP
jgi:ABC transporter ATM